MLAQATIQGNYPRVSQISSIVRFIETGIKSRGRLFSAYSGMLDMQTSVLPFLEPHR
jgi:hypothetical protein